MRMRTRHGLGRERVLSKSRYAGSMAVVVRMAKMLMLVMMPTEMRKGWV